MKIDGMVRGAKQEQAQESHLKDGQKRKAATLPEDIDSDDSAAMDVAKKQQRKRIKKLMK